MLLWGDAVPASIPALQVCHVAIKLGQWRPGLRVTKPTLLSSPCRTKSSLSPSSHGPVWEAGSWMAVPSTPGRSWCWSECQLSSMAPCTAALHRTHWVPLTPTPASLSLVRHCPSPTCPLSSFLPLNPFLCWFFSLENPNIPRGTEDSNGKWWLEVR